MYIYIYICMCIYVCVCVLTRADTGGEPADNLLNTETHGSPCRLQGKEWTHMEGHVQILVGSLLATC